jgi:hypothetical protein
MSIPYLVLREALRASGKLDLLREKPPRLKALGNEGPESSAFDLDREIKAMLPREGENRRLELKARATERANAEARPQLSAKIIASIAAFMNSSKRLRNRDSSLTKSRVTNRE